MSHDAANKTEKPTPRRIQQAREQGQVAKSQDFNGSVVLATATLLMVVMGPYMVITMYSTMVHTFSDLNRYARYPMTVDSFPHVLEGIIYAIFWILAPLLIAVLVMAIFSNLLQVKPLFAIKAVQPKLDKINPINGFKRIMSMRSLVEVGKAIVKMLIIGGCGTLIIMGHLDQLMGLAIADLEAGWMEILQVVGLIAVWSSALFFTLGMIDWRYQAYEMEKQLRMSRQEIKDERKNQEGDPMVKNRIRQMGIQIAKNRQLAEVPTADVVITNPTHFAVAIKYDPDIAPAPAVVAKGVDHFALKIREVAKENKVPMVENVPLARTLYKMSEVGSMIPPDLFVAVAEVLAYVYAKNRGRKLHGKLKKPERAHN